jgi:hypothetical protein
VKLEGETEVEAEITTSLKAKLEKAFELKKGGFKIGAGLQLDLDDAAKLKEMFFPLGGELEF